MYRTKLEPIKPAPPVINKRKLAVLPAPVVRDLTAMRPNAVFVGLVVFVDLGGNIDYQGLILADALEAVINKRRDLQYLLVVAAHEEFVDLAERGGVFPRIV